MRTRTKIILVACLVLLGVGFFAHPTHVESVGLTATGRRPGEPLRSKMRTLWGDHISYTRNYITSALGGLGDKSAVAARLMENQDDIASEFKPYYGLAYSEKLATLLRAHINIAAELVDAVKAGRATAVKKAQTQWAANGVEITDLLIGANAHWDRQEVASMLKDHLELTTREVEARMSLDWKGDIENYDRLHDHMLMFSDYLVNGLEQQFRNDPKAPSSLTQNLEAEDFGPMIRVSRDQR